MKPVSAFRGPGGRRDCRSTGSAGFLDRDARVGIAAGGVVVDLLGVLRVPVTVVAAVVRVAVESVLEKDTLDLRCLEGVIASEDRLLLFGVT